MLIRLSGYKVCSFFGHPKIDITDELIAKLTETVENLIEIENVKEFLFGASTDFDRLCHKVVTEFQKKHPDITRVAYDTPYEGSSLEEERKGMEELLSKFHKRPMYVEGYEEVATPPAIYVPERICDEIRNEAMINDSDFCVFYYDENYKPDEKLYRKRFTARTKSDIKKAFKYATLSGKTIINLFS